MVAYHLCRSHAEERTRASVVCMGVVVWWALGVLLLLFFSFFLSSGPGVCGGVPPFLTANTRVPLRSSITDTGTAPSERGGGGETKIVAVVVVVIDRSWYSST